MGDRLGASKENYTVGQGNFQVAERNMIFGYNTDVKSGDTVYHVQTEDRGEKNPVIDSVIYVKGRIIDRRRTQYEPTATRSERLQEMVKQQHRELVEAIRGGTYVPPEEGSPPAAAVAPTVAPAREATPEPVLELLNPEEIEADGQLVFRLRVHDSASKRPLAGVLVQGVLCPGKEQETRSQATASSEGLAQITFAAPSGEDAAVLFQASAGGGAGFLKFRLLRE